MKVDKKYNKDSFFKELIKEVVEDYMHIMNKKSHLFLERDVELSIEDDFELKSILRDIFNYIRGKDISMQKIEGHIADIIILVWDNPFIDKERIEVDWSYWEEKKLGKLVLIAKSNMRFEQKKDLTPKQLALLMGYTPNGIRKQIKDGRLDASKVNNIWLIDYKSCKTLLEGE